MDSHEKTYIISNNIGGFFWKKGRQGEYVLTFDKHKAKRFTEDQYAEACRIADYIKGMVYPAYMFGLT